MFNIYVLDRNDNDKRQNRRRLKEKTHCLSVSNALTALARVICNKHEHASVTLRSVIHALHIAPVHTPLTGEECDHYHILCDKIPQKQQACFHFDLIQTLAHQGQSERAKETRTSCGVDAGRVTMAHVIKHNQQEEMEVNQTEPKGIIHALEREVVEEGQSVIGWHFEMMSSCCLCKKSANLRTFF